MVLWLFRATGAPAQARLAEGQCPSEDGYEGDPVGPLAVHCVELSDSESWATAERRWQYEAWGVGGQFGFELCLNLTKVETVGHKNVVVVWSWSWVFTFSSLELFWVFQAHKIPAFIKFLFPNSLANTSYIFQKCLIQKLSI